MPVAYKKAKEISKGGKSSYELARQLLLSYFSLKGKSNRKKVKEFLLNGVKVTFPEWLEEKLKKEYDVEKLKESLLKKVTWIRVNTLKADEDKVLKEIENEGIIVERDRDIKYAYKVLKGDINKAKAFKEFKIIAQDKASMAVVEALKPEKSELIYDMTSAPGAKASLIMALTENSSKLIVADIDPKRLEKERKFLHDVGVDLNKVEFILQDSTNKSIRKADKVLLDTPCSLTGMIANEPTVLIRLTKDKVDYYSSLQKRLLEAAVSTSSYVIYASCSLLPEEGEEVVKGYNAKAPLNFGISKGIGNRFVPYIHETEGFFISKIET